MTRYKISVRCVWTGLSWDVAKERARVLVDQGALFEISEDTDWREPPAPVLRPDPVPIPAPAPEPPNTKATRCWICGGTYTERGLPIHVARAHRRKRRKARKRGRTVTIHVKDPAPRPRKKRRAKPKKWTTRKTGGSRETRSEPGSSEPAPAGAGRGGSVPYPRPKICPKCGLGLRTPAAWGIHQSRMHPTSGDSAEPAEDGSTRRTSGESS